MSSSAPAAKNPWAAPFVPIEALNAAERVHVVDLRSPAEFEHDHLPQAVNLPLFEDVERALIGTLYKRHSPQEAFDEGRRILLERITPLVTEIARLCDREPPHADLPACVERLTTGGIEAVNRALTPLVLTKVPEGALVVHCWRGGLRSASLTVLLRELGWEDVFALQGGYKSYRTRVLAELEGWQAPPSFILRGSTGVGKTLVLRELERLRPGWTLDLEGIAGHRSSILGMVGLQPCSQKTFDSRLAERLRAGFPGSVVIEGESRKVGDAIVPDRVWQALQEGVHLQLEASVEYRVQVLIDDYLATDESRIELRKQLPFIESRLGPKKWAGELVARLDDGREEELTAILLELYYDPLYRHSEKGRDYAATFDASDVSRVARELIAWIEARRS